MRRGSMEFWPHRRAKKEMPRVRSWKDIAEPSFLGLVAFKAGMTHVAMLDDSNSPSKGSEIVRPATILELPKVFVYGIRFYEKDTYKEAATEYYSKELVEKLGIKKAKNTAEKLSDIKKDLSSFTDASALMFANPSNLNFGNKKIMRFEVPVGGTTITEKVEFLEKWLGKEVKVSDVLKEGEYIDTTSISKGKGWAGPIKRFGVARQFHKATNKIRHLGTLGPWHPPKVMYTVPRAGHLGYNYRTELNKRIVKIGTVDEAPSINQKGGIINYGIIKSEFMLIDGSIPGPAKRLIRVRKALRKGEQDIKKPEITYISVASKQGA